MVVRLCKRYVLGGYWLEPDRQLLFDGAQPIHLSKKPFQVLLYLIEHRDRFVSTNELLEHFWDGKEVYDDSARKSVSAVRKALNDHTGEPRFIETRWGWGYRYVGPFEEQTITDDQPASGSIEGHETPDLKQERESQGATPVAEETLAPLSSTHDVPHAPQRDRKFLALILTLLVVGVAAAALIAYRGRAVPAEARKAGPPPLYSVAVLPLKNLTNDPANDYLSDGLTESLINALSKIRGLKVISRGSAFSFKGQNVDPQELRQKLGVAALLQGGVFKDGERLRVEVRLVNTEDGHVRWAGEPYDRKLDDIFGLQDEIARKVVSGLAYQLSAEEERRIRGRDTNNRAAYEAYLRGRYHWYKRTPEGLKQSLKYFQEAIKLDPNYALAYAGVADYYEMAVYFSRLPPQEATDQAKAAARRAQELDDGLAETHISLAGAYRMAWEWKASAREIERALEIDPNNAEAHHEYAYVLLLMGQADSAVAEIKRARELDPLSIVANVDVGEILLYARRYDEAAAALRHALEMDSNRPNAHWDLARALQQQGTDETAFDEYVRNAMLSGWSPEAISALREGYADAGLRGFWQKWLEFGLKQARHDYLPPFILAQSYAQLGDPDQAFVCLEQAYREHSPNLTDLKADPLLDPLHDDPRFAQLVARVGL